MKIAAISDVHVTSPHDEADKFLISFLDHPLVMESDYILLLGDIFDLMCGPHEEYLRSYSHIFERLFSLVAEGKRVFFFEGNHDVHIEKLLKKMGDGIVVSQDPVIEMIDGKRYYFSHGDEHEVDNLSYHRYIRFIRSRPLKFIAEYVMPYRVLDFLGKRASKISRKKGSRSFDVEGVRTRFRQGVEKTTQGQFDFVLGGHSHVQDEFTIPGTQCVYLNNGYALKTKTFIYIDQHTPKFIQLS